MTMQARNRQRKCYWFRLDIFLSWPGGSGAWRFPVMAWWQWGMAFSCHGLVAVGHGVFLSWPCGSGAWRFLVMAWWQWGIAFSCHGLEAVGHGVFRSWPGGSWAWRFPVMAWQWGMAFSGQGLAVGHGVFLSWSGGSGAWRFLVMDWWQWGTDKVFKSEAGLKSNKKCKHFQALFACSVNSNAKQGFLVLFFVLFFCFVFRF